MFNSEMFRRILSYRGLKSPDKICLYTFYFELLFGFVIFKRLICFNSK